MSYKSVIDSLKVVTNPKYQPSDGNTYCNVFAQDVMSAMGTNLPTGTANDIADGLYGNGFSKWRSVNAMTAQSRANDGTSTVGVLAVPGGHGHVVVIYPHGSTPSSNTDWHNIYMSQAGASCYNDEWISKSWKSADLPNVKFYSWYA